MSNYSDALEFFIENGIYLNDGQSLDLYCTMEGANIELGKTYLKYVKIIKNANNQLSKARKSGDYKAAKAACATMRNAYLAYQKDINNIDYTTSSNVISQVIYATLTMSLALLGPLARKFQNNKFDEDLGNMNYELDYNKAYYRGVQFQLRLKRKRFTDDAKKDIEDFISNQEKDRDKYANLTGKFRKANLVGAIVTPIAAAIAAAKELKIAREDIKKNGGKIKNLNMLRADINNSIKNNLKVLDAIEKNIDQTVKR